MRGIVLMEREEEKYETIKRVADGDINKSRARVILGLSKRQISRLVLKYKNEGKAAFVHGNRSRTPSNKILDSKTTNIIIYIKKNYLIKFKNGIDIPNFKHLLEMYNEEKNDNISYSTFYRLMMRNNIRSPKIHRATRIKIKKLEILKRVKNIEEKDLVEMTTHELRIEDAHPLKRRCEFFGEEIQIDASSQWWTPDLFAHLHLAIDNATGDPVGAYFDKQETLNGYYNVFRQILINYGVPLLIKTDKRTVFYYLNKNRSTEEDDTMTQFGYACKLLGVKLKCSSIPEFKPLVERDNGIFEDRLRSELTILGIKTIEKANQYLINVFLPKFIKKFGGRVSHSKSVFVKIEKSMVDYYLSIIVKRKISSGSIIHYQNNQYVILNERNERLFFNEKTDCLVIKTFKNELFCSVDNKIYLIKKFSNKENYLLKMNRNSFNNHPIVNFIPNVPSAWVYNKFKSFEEIFKIDNYSRVNV